MKNLFISFEDLTSSIQELIDHLNAEHEVKNNIFHIVLPVNDGKGSLTNGIFHQSFGFTSIRCKFNHEIIINIKSNIKKQLVFTFCIQGKAYFKPIDDKDVEILPAEGFIVPNGDQKLFIPKDLDVNILFLFVNRVNIEKDDEVLFNEDHETPQKFSYNLHIADMLNLISTNTYQGIVKQFFIEAKLLELASQVFLLLSQKTLRTHGKDVSLNKEDVELIVKAKGILMKDLANPPTIKELSKLIGMNERKLQYGFKMVFDETINKFVRKSRFTFARQLLDQGKYTVQEIAEKVGYTNKSHFTERFKERYGMLPSEYLKKASTKVEIDTDK